MDRHTLDRRDEERPPDRLTLDRRESVERPDIAGEFF